MSRERDRLSRMVRAEDLADPRIVEAFETTDRGDFVPPSYRDAAYDDRPVSLPQDQTTSQPTLIARMIDAAAPRPGDRVLEVGTGYGFQTALLARLGAEVVSIERHPELAEAARDNLARAGIEGVTVVVGDGWEGYSPSAPYQAIVVSAAAHSVPPALAAQLGVGGRLVIPIRTGRSDDVFLFVKEVDGLGPGLLLTPARFVPLVRQERQDPHRIDVDDKEDGR